MNTNSFEKIPEGGPETKQSALFNLAIIIMGTVSCYTTAMGLTPMLGNQLFSIAVAAALSLIMVAIALQLPKAYQENRQAGMILSYVFVAAFSVLLNYNFIFGKLAISKYDLEALAIVAKEKRSIANEEFQNNIHPGKGKIHRQKDQIARIAEQQLTANQENYDALINPIKADMDTILMTTNAALAQADWEIYGQTIPLLTTAHNKLGSKLKSQLPTFAFETRRFENRDIGQLSHSLGSMFSAKKNGGSRQKDKKAFQGFLSTKNITQEPLIVERNF